VTRTTVVVGRIVVGGHVDNGPGLNSQIAVFEKGGSVFPFKDLHVTGDVHRPAPGVVAQRAFNDLIDVESPAADDDLSR
jgi:hypothetical protein